MHPTQPLRTTTCTTIRTTIRTISRTLVATPARRFVVLAALALGASSGAQAQSNVTLYGLIDLSAGSFQSPGGVAKKAIDSGNMSTSYWGLKGTEDLGDGLQANFVLESFMRNDTGASGRFDGDTYWARTSSVGLSNRFGAINLGRNTTSLFVQTLLFNAFGDSFGFSPSIRHYFISGTTTGDTGWNDSIKYNSPSVAGFSFTAHAALGEGNGGRNTGLSALYFGGPLALGASWQAVKKGATVADTTTWQLAGSYDFKGVKLYAQYGEVTNDSSLNHYAISGIGGELNIGAGKLMAQYSQVSPDVGANRKAASLGYDHFLSKRTDLYAVYMQDRLSGLANGNNYAAGIRHRF
jgi:predicted porin